MKIIKTIIRHIVFRFDYYIGPLFVKESRYDEYRYYMMSTYPDFYPNEIKYLEDKNAR